MVIEIGLERDSESSYPACYRKLRVETEDESDTVTLELRDPEREIEVKKSDLRKVLQILL